MIALAKSVVENSLSFQSLPLACHHFDVIEIVHLEQNLVWFEFEKVRLSWQEDCQISCLKLESLIFLRACHYSMSKKFVWICQFLGKISTLISHLSNALKASQPILPYCIYPAMQWCNVMYQVTECGYPERAFLRKSQTQRVFLADLSAPISITVGSLSMFSI